MAHPAVLAIMSKMHPGDSETPPSTGSPGASSDDGLSVCAEDMLSAIEAKDVAGLTSALKAAFEFLESQPHEEAGNEGE